MLKKRHPVSDETDLGSDCLGWVACVFHQLKQQTETCVLHVIVREMNLKSSQYYFFLMVRNVKVPEIQINHSQRCA